MNTIPCFKSTSYEYVQIPLWSMNTVENYPNREERAVQIPLWSMNTLPASILVSAWLCSDSSMVDEYRGLAPALSYHL